MAGVVLRTPGLGVLTHDATRLEVWGDPIAHSRSPELHAAAYALLGFSWTYGRRRVTEETFTAELDSLDGTWRGLSLTMPLKGPAFAAAVDVDRHARLTGAANTLLLDPAGPRGFNTDVGGIIRALADDDLTEVDRARIVGAGATATSALVALAELGARHVEVVARREGAAEKLKELAARIGVEVSAAPLVSDRFAPVPLTIATLPGDAHLPGDVAAALARSGGLLLDVVYGHWPTALSSAWDDARGTARSGLGMLLHQAVLQIRIFAHGDADAALPDEERIIEAMRGVLERPPSA